MHFSALTAFLSVLNLVLAQYGYGDSNSAATVTAAAASVQTSSSTTTSSTGATIHVVEVGNGGLSFSPNTITAAKGDLVEFHFYGPKHSVAQSSFAAPCVPLNATEGFFSGPITTTGTGENAEIFALSINDTAPIWFYCSVLSHCGSGMAGVINQASTGTKTLAAYVKAASGLKSTIPSTVQGGIFSTNSSSSSDTSTASETTTTTSSSSSSTPSSAGIEARGTMKWVLSAGMGLIAVGMGGLIA